MCISNRSDVNEKSTFAGTTSTSSKTEKLTVNFRMIKIYFLLTHVSNFFKEKYFDSPTQILYQSSCNKQLLSESNQGHCGACVETHTIPKDQDLAVRIIDHSIANR